MTTLNHPLNQIACLSCFSPITDEVNDGKYADDLCRFCELARIENAPQLMIALEQLLQAPDVNREDLSKATHDACDFAYNAIHNAKSRSFSD